MPMSHKTKEDARCERSNDLEFMASPSNWREGATGDWAKDNELGRERANQLRANLKMTGNYPAALGCIKSLVENGHFGGIEVGFFQRLTELAAR